VPHLRPDRAAALWDVITGLEDLEDVRVLGTMAAP
jgi:hypothetical protein